MSLKMEIVKKIKTALGLDTSYKLWKATNERGVKISMNGLFNYEKKPVTSMRLDVLATWQEMVAEKGVALETFWGWLKKDLKDNK